MGSLKDLSNPTIHKHLLLSDSGKASLYVHDKLKETYKAGVDSVYSVKSKTDFSEMLELSGIQPYLAERWIFEINWKSCRSMLRKDKWVLDSDSSCFCIIAGNYREFKEAKEFLKESNDMYLNQIRRWDTLYLLEGLDVSDKIKDFVAVSYQKDVEKVFQFKEILESGIEINSNRDVVKYLGTTSSSVSHYAMLLLNDPPETEKGYKRVYSKRVSLGIDLCNAYTCRTFRNFLSSTVYDILQLKVLYMQAVFYNKVENIPDITDEKKNPVYDISKLNKYNMYLERITKEIPYSRILRLYSLLQEKENKVWHTTNDMLCFLYTYYGGLKDGTISEL